MNSPRGMFPLSLSFVFLICYFNLKILDLQVPVKIELFFRLVYRLVENGTQQCLQSLVYLHNHVS